MKALTYSYCSLFCALAVFNETSEGVQQSFLTAFVILAAMALAEICNVKKPDSAQDEVKS